MSRHNPSIFQGRFDFSSVRGHASLTIEHPAERIAFRVCIAALAMLGFGYLYFVGASVLNVIARKEALAHTAHLASAVSNLEREYFAESKRIAPGEGVHLGLVPVSATAYVHRPASTVAATIGINEI